jgi:hypothetical protein
VIKEKSFIEIATTLPYFVVALVAKKKLYSNDQCSSLFCRSIGSKKEFNDNGKHSSFSVRAAATKEKSFIAMTKHSSLCCSGISCKEKVFYDNNKCSSLLCRSNGG